MSAFRNLVQSLRLGIAALLAIVFLAGCIGDDEAKKQGFTRLDLAQVPVAPANPTPHASTATSTEGLGGVTGAIPPTEARTLSATQLVAMQPNELGVVPVLMYHAFVSGPTDDEWTRRLGDFRGDLQWLYDHDFYIVPMRELIDDTISAPPGKHPVVLTFDDASARQFQFEQNADGELVPTADSAVGVLEAFFAEHPDFGHTSMFAVVPNNCFAFDDEPFNTVEYCGQKLQWLAANGYEVANHTWSHQDLSDASSDTVRAQIGDTMDFIDTYVEGPGNLSRVLVLPFGAIPDPTVDWWAWSFVYEQFTWGGEPVSLEAVVNVHGGVTPSPSSTLWDPLAVARFNTTPDDIAMWFGAFENGDVTLYTSDGNPQTVVVPDTMDALLAEEFDPAMLATDGKTALTYDPDSGKVAAVRSPRDTTASTHRANASTAAWHRSRETALAL